MLEDGRACPGKACIELLYVLAVSSIISSMRHPNFVKMAEARILRAKGKTIREIACAMKSDVKTVHRWLNYDIQKYPKYALFWNVGSYPQQGRNAA